MNEPIKKSFTREEMINYAKMWVRRNYGYTESYNEKMGLVFDFTTDLFDGNFLEPVKDAANLNKGKNE